MSTGQNGKGSRRRPTNEQAYRDSWDRVFGKQIKCSHCGEALRPNDFTGMRAYWIAGRAYHAPDICRPKSS